MSTTEFSFTNHFLPQKTNGLADYYSLTVGNDDLKKFAIEKDDMLVIDAGMIETIGDFIAIAPSLNNEIIIVGKLISLDEVTLTIDCGVSIQNFINSSTQNDWMCLGVIISVHRQFVSSKQVVK